MPFSKVPGSVCSQFNDFVHKRISDARVRECVYFTAAVLYSIFLMLLMEAHQQSKTKLFVLQNRNITQTIKT